jgi:exopolysaccharide biosynthesis polyprenyl glycosylphosphotransferase
LGGGNPYPYQTALRARRILGTVAFTIAPAVAAGAMAGNHLHDLGIGAIVFVAIIATSLAVERERIPLHLMPLASFVVRAFVPVIGIGVAMLILVLIGKPFEAVDMAAPLIGAWFVMACAAWVTGRFESSRHVRVAMIGHPGIATGMAYELDKAKLSFYEVVGWLADRPPAAEPSVGPHWLGSLEDVREVIEDHNIELLVHASGAPGSEIDVPRLELFEQVAQNCLDLPVRMIEASQLYEALLGHVPLGQSTSAWFQYLLHPRYRAGSPLSKRCFDLVVASLMLIFMMPFLIGFAIAVKLTDGGPIFYRQRRVGEGGKEFEMVKLRSMRVTSEDAGARWAQNEDDRVTAVGAIMRRLHIDEMPQLINVLRGEMTIVGPRPERRELIVNLERQLPYYDRRHLVKPGLAGWAQACCGYGGSEQGTSWKLCHDLYYLKHRSVYFDFLILVENVRVSLSGVQFGVDAPQEQFILGQSGEIR